MTRTGSTWSRSSDEDMSTKEESKQIESIRWKQLYIYVGPMHSCCFLVKYVFDETAWKTDNLLTSPINLTNVCQINDHFLLLSGGYQQKRFTIAKFGL